jgi:hypothetical protein
VKRAAPQAALHVWQDPSCPLGRADVVKLLVNKVSIHTSNVAHSTAAGPLTGLRHLTQQLESLASVGQERAWVVKIDSDTVVRRIDWLENRDQSNAIGFTEGPAKPWAGPCYALRQGVAVMLLRTLRQSCPELQLPHGLPEDGAISRLLDLSGIYGICRLPAWPAPFFAGYDYPSTQPDGAELLHYNQSVLHCGNRDSRPSRPRVAALMGLAAQG